MSADGVELWCKDNRTWDERVRDKALGLIKYHLIETKDILKSSVKIDWGSGFVKIRRNCVFQKNASVSDDAELVFSDEGLDVKDVVESSLQEWLAKRDRIE